MLQSAQRGVMFGRFKTPARTKRKARSQPREYVLPSHAAADSAQLAAIAKRLDILAERDKKAKALFERFERATRRAQEATTELASAREERDQYRRVLAAAIGAERRTEDRLARADERRESAERAAREEARAAGAASAERDALSERVASLEELMKSQANGNERAIADLADRSWAEREALRADLVKLGLAAEKAAAHAARGSEIGGIRRRLLVGLGVTAAVLGIAVTPPAVISAFDPERAMFVHMASGLSPWALIGCAAGAFVLALVLLSIAKKDADQRARAA